MARLPGLKPPPGYHTLAQTGERLMALAQGGLGRLFVLGHSVRGRPIWGFHLGPGREQAPQVMIQAQIHANEWIGTELCLALLEHYAVQPPHLATGLWVLPGVNPDGFERNLRRLGHDLMALGRKNAHGVDLNRNFPVGFYHRDKGFFSGSKNALSPYYKGPYPLSEPESQTLARVVEEQNIRACLSLHAYGAFVGYPPCYKRTPTPHHALFTRWASAMTGAQPKPYRHDMEVNFYPAYGDFDDWLYEHHGALAFLVEVGDMGLDLNNPLTWLQPFYWFNPPDVKREIHNVLPLLKTFVALAQERENLPGPNVRTKKG